MLVCGHFVYSVCTVWHHEKENLKEELDFLGQDDRLGHMKKSLH